jgi:hypothetical protein
MPEVFPKRIQLWVKDGGSSGIEKIDPTYRIHFHDESTLT